MPSGQVAADNILAATIARSRRGHENLPDAASRGAIAQLGERLDRTQEVAGSSPASSIGSPCKRSCFLLVAAALRLAAFG
jgi:hypothetical protein